MVQSRQKVDGLGAARSPALCRKLGTTCVGMDHLCRHFWRYTPCVRDFRLHRDIRHYPCTQCHCNGVTVYQKEWALREQILKAAWDLWASIELDGQAAAPGPPPPQLSLL